MNKSYYMRAYVSVVLGDRWVSNTMAKLDLGLNGVGNLKMMIIIYNLGEKVDATRVRDTMDKAILESKHSDSKLILLSYELRSIEKVVI